MNIGDIGAVEFVIAFLVGTLSAARLSRLIVDDDMPLIIPLRGWYVRKAPESWMDLITCGFCMSFWTTLFVGGWAWISELHWTWWAFNSIFAGAYLAAMIQARDLPTG